MSLHRWGAKRDAAEKPIRQALEAIGIPRAPKELGVNGYWPLSGEGIGDLMVRFRGVIYVGEVKSTGGTLTEHQGAFPIWRTPDNVLRAIGAIR